MKRKKKNGRSTPLAFLFFLFLIFAISFSFSIKLFFLIREGKFENGNTFTVYATNKSQNKLITFKKNTNSISILDITGDTNDIYKKLQTPVEATYYDKNLNLDKPVSEIISDLLFSISTSNNNLNVIDGVKATIASRITSPRDIVSGSLDLNDPDREIDKKIQEMLVDAEIKKENLTIEVINASGEQGVGSRYARLFTNMGGSVILVSNTQDKTKSGVYKVSDSYTADRLGSVLNFPVIDKKISTIADIAVVIGEGYNRTSKY